MSKAWDEVLSQAVKVKIIPDIIWRILLWGPPRTGKTFLPATLFPRLERITFHRQMPVEDMLGGWCLQNGSTEWANGPFVRAMIEGIPIVCDEIDQFSPESRCSLHACLDDPAAITLANGERIVARPGYCVIATTNALPSALPDALYDRFDMILKADTLSQGLQKFLGKLAVPASTVVGRGSASLDWKRMGSVNLFVAAAKLRQKGFRDEQIPEALGLNADEAMDFLAAIATR